MVIDLKSLKDGDKIVGFLYVQSYTKKLNPESKAPLNGVAMFQGKTMGFKMWDARLQALFNENDLTNTIIKVIGSVGTYQNNLEITVTEVYLDHGFTDKGAFLKSANVDKLFTEFADFLTNNLSEKAVKLLTHIFNSENLYGAFKTCYAGSKMHDAQIGGLMNHTLKMLRLAKTLLENDSRLQPYMDLLYLNIILHDIGKIHEIGEGGAYTDISFVTHRTLGLELTCRHKEAIIATYDEKFFYHILAVQQGHHGEYGDKPTTIWAYIIHLIDMLESTVTGMMDRIENSEFQMKNGNKVLWVHGDNLVI